MDNKFVVLSLIEDLLHPQLPLPEECFVAKPREETAISEEYLTAASPTDDPGETQHRKRQRIKAVRHLPSLAKKMGETYAHAEVVPFLERCVADDDADLAVAVAQIVPHLALPSVAVQLSVDRNKEPSAVLPLEALLPIALQLAGCRSETVRAEMFKVTFPMVFGGRWSSTDGIEQTTPLQLHEHLLELASNLMWSNYPLQRATGVRLAATYFGMYCKEAEAKSSTLARQVAMKLREILDEFLFAPRPESEKKPRHQQQPHLSLMDRHFLVVLSVLRTMHLLVPDTLPVPPSAQSRTAIGVCDQPQPSGAVPAVISWEKCFEILEAILNQDPSRKEVALSTRHLPLAAQCYDVAAAVMEAVLQLVDKIGAMCLAQFGFQNKNRTINTAEVVLLLMRRIVKPLLSMRKYNNWKMRFLVASKIDCVARRVFLQLAEILEKANAPAAIWALVVEEYYVSVYINTTLSELAADNETEVRIVAAAQFAKAVPLRSTLLRRALRFENFMEEFLNLASVFVGDDSSRVRASMAASLPQLLALSFSGGSQWVDVAVGLLMTLVGDDVPAVQLAVASVLGDVLRNPDIGDTVILKLKRELLALAAKVLRHEQWRVRESFVRVLPNISFQIMFCPSGTQKSEDDFGKRELIPILAATLFDKVKSVRDAALDGLVEFVELANKATGNDDLLNQVLWPAIVLLPQSSDTYLARMSLLHVAQQLVISVDHFLTLIKRLSADKISNVRMVVAKVIRTLLAGPTEKSAQQAGQRRFVVDEALKQGPFLAVLRTLIEDPDVDVRHFASEALAACI